MRSLGQLAHRHLTRRPGRSLLTGGGTALGVAVLFAVLVTTAGATDALDRALAGQAGRADVVVQPNGGYDAVLPDGAERRVAAVDGVESATPSLLLRSLVEPPGRDRPLDSRSEIVMVVATRLDEAAGVKELELVEGRAPERGAAELAVPAQLVDDLDLPVGTVADVTTPTGRHAAEVVGVIADAGAGLSYQGDVAYTSLELGRQWDGRAGAVNSLDVVLEDGVDTGSWIDAHRAELGPGLAPVPAEDVAADFAEFISSVTSGLTLMSVIALFVGGFLVFLTFSLAVAERTRVHGTLRALGALPRQVRRVVVAEAAVLGLVSSLVGLGLGFLLANAAVGVTGRLLDLRMPDIGLPVGTAAASVGVGVGLSVLAAWLPGRRAAAVSPLTAMRSGAEGIETSGRVVPRVALLVGAIALSFAELPVIASALVTLALLLGAVLCVPFALGPVANVVGRVTARLGRGVGTIAVMHLVKERSRSAYTLALVMVVLGMLLGVAGTNQATGRLLDRMLDEQGSNIQVGAPSAFDPAVGDQLRGLDGVEAVTPMRFGQASVVTGDDVTRNALTMIEPETYFPVAGFVYDDGDAARARQALSAGGSVLLPTETASQLGVHVGETLDIRTGGSGTRPFTVAATFRQVGGGFGAVMNVADAGAGHPRPNLFLVQPTDPAETGAVVDRIDQALSPDYALVVDTPEGTRAWAFGQLQGFFSLAYVVLGLAALIGLLGLANTLAVSVISRTREIGILRSAGTLRRQVWAMVLVEATTLSVVAFVFAVPLGGLLTADDFTAELEFAYPVAWLLPLLVVTLTVSALASVLPARAAGRLEPVVALRFD